jgi:NitT/TauT family transport system substrate-binding protein
MKGWYEAIKFWRANPAEGNAIIARGIKFETPAVEETLGADGKPKVGGMYVYSFEEVAKYMGLMPGDAPEGQANGQVKATTKLTNDWWVKFGIMKKDMPFETAVDLTPVKLLVDEGYKAEAK